MLVYTKTAFMFASAQLYNVVPCCSFARFQVYYSVVFLVLNALLILVHSSGKCSTC